MGLICPHTTSEATFELLDRRLEGLRGHPRVLAVGRCFRRRRLCYGKVGAVVGGRPVLGWSRWREIELGTWKGRKALFKAAILVVVLLLLALGLHHSSFRASLYSPSP